MRWSGKLGYSEQTETSPGVWENVITEREALGQVKQRTEVLNPSDTVLPRYETSTSISVLSQGTDKIDYSNLAYVTYKGKNWVPRNIVEDFPRMTIFIGEEYHGPLPG